MRNSFYQGIGGVVSADIAVPEHAKELAFYASILTTGDSPLWRDDLTNNQGTPIIGLGKRTPEYDSLPLQWMPHIQVEDVASCVQRAVELGGIELMHGKHENGESLWAGIQDPSGAAFGIIPVVSDEAYSIHDRVRVGHITSLSIIVEDVKSTGDFYEQVIGWSSTPNDSDAIREMLQPNGEYSVAQIIKKDDLHTSIPSAWILSLPVGDIEESLQRVRVMDGEVIGNEVDSPRSIIRDPVGVCIALQPSN